MSTDYADIIKRAQRGPSSAKLAKEGRQFEKHEWLEFECHPGKPTEDMRQIARDFTKRVVNLTDDWLVEHGKRELIGAADEDQLAWLAYASIVGHGVGLWEKEGSTGLPGDVEGSLDTIVKNDQIASRMAHALSDMCSLEREEHETAGKRIRGKGKRELNEQPRDPVLDEDTELGYVKNGTFVDPEEEARRQRERFWGTPGAGERGTVSMRNAIEIARKLGIRPEDQPAGWLTQFTYGINAELAEHADVTKGDLVQTGRIALAHLDEAPDYYERLARVGLEDKATVVAEPARLPGDTGTIDDEQKILHHAAVTGSVPSYLYDIAALRRLERRGLLAHPKQIADFHVFWITDAGRQAFARGVYGGELRPFSPDAPCARHDMVNAHRCDEPAGRQRQARDYDSPDDALAGVHDFLGAEWYERHGDKVTVYAQIDHVWYKATLAKSRGPYHWPSAWVDRVRALPKNVRPIARVVPGVAEPVKDNPVGADDGIPWVQITRDPERYQAAMAHAKRLGVMNEPGKVYDLLAPALAKEDQEVILVVLFDVRGQCRGVAEVHRGQRSRVDVSTADIMRIVLVSGAEGFMLVHNHPSGDASPSDKDGELTKAVSKAAAVHPEIAYLDHLVIGLGQYYTFTGRKLVKVKSDIDSKPKKKKKKKGNRR